MKKTTFIIYASVSVATLIFALAFRQYVNVHIESLAPAFNIVGMLYISYTTYNQKRYYSRANGRWISYTDGFDFYYSKNKKGEGDFQVQTHQKTPQKSNVISAYVIIWGASLNIPLIFLFNYKTKLLCFAVMIVTVLISAIITMPADIKETKEVEAEEKAKSERWKKELEEQKKREEMGRWK